MTLTLRNVQTDVPPDVHDATVAFWAAALGATTRDAAGPHTHLVGPRSACGLHVQRRDDRERRLHLDLDSTDVPADLDRLAAAGGERVGERPQGDGIVVASPAGLLVCVIEAGRIVPELGAHGPSDTHLDALLADVPSDRVDAEVAFWIAAFEVDAPAVHEGPYVGLGTVPAVGGTIGLAVQDIGEDPARFHIDLAAVDVAAEAARLAGAGAAHVADVEDWVVLTDPADLAFCVVPLETA